MIIKWCLNLKLMSTGTYHALRTSGFLTLPSERTLRDYSNLFHQKMGYQSEVMYQLLAEVTSLNITEEQMYVGLLLDEMKVREGLVYNKFNGEVIGFTHLGDVNDQFDVLEQKDGSRVHKVATHILVIMVRGLLFKLEFPLAHFSTIGITYEYLFPIVWEGIRLLETYGLKVLCVTCDGASPNRKFFGMQKRSSDHTLCYKTCNVYTDEERSVYFLSDPPHLMKTTRNCWSKLGIHGTRHMQVCVQQYH